jgi:hypothetical protein
LCSSELSLTVIEYVPRLTIETRLPDAVLRAIVSPGPTLPVSLDGAALAVDQVARASAANRLAIAAVVIAIVLFVMS